MFNSIGTALSRLADFIWTPFNRDTLRNLCLPYEHCTYDPSRVRKGLIFCHVDDRTQRRWIRGDLALVVSRVLGSDRFELITRLNVCRPKETDPALLPIRVRTSSGHRFAEGDVFTVYGQYLYDGFAYDDAGIGCHTLHQINDRNEHVFKEPFIDFGTCDR